MPTWNDATSSWEADDTGESVSGNYDSSGNTGESVSGNYDSPYVPPWYTSGEIPAGKTFDSFGNLVDIGSTAAANADPNGIAQGYLNALQQGQNVNFGGALNAFKGLLAGGGIGQAAGIAGMSALFNKLTGGGLGQSGQGVYKGYQGSIPSYTASRTMNPIPQTVPTAAQAEVPATATHAAIPAVPAGTAPRRPGSGGITYFSPMQYVPKVVPAAGGGMMSSGGVSALGGYSDGGRLLKGPGDGVSDSIPATIGGKQPARLADGEFVIPARIVSEIGNGSTEAGAKKLYAMMDRVQSVRRKSFKNVAANTKADKYLPR